MISNNIFYVYVLFKTYTDGEYKYGDLKFVHEPFYVGKGFTDKVTGYNRLYKSLRGGNKHKTNIIKKHKNLGLDITFKIMKTNLSETLAHDYEKELIKKIGRTIYGGPLTNATDGGEGRYGEQPEKFKCIYMFDVNGKFIKKYDAIKICEKDMNIPQRNISDCCLGNRYTAGGYIFRYASDFKVIPKEIDISFLEKRMHQGNKEIAVEQYDKEMNLINTFKSVKEAAKYSGALSSKIVAVCKGTYGAKTAKGFIWKYVNI